MFEELESRFVDVEGIKTHYIDEGEGDEIIMLVHGGGAGADSKGNFSTNFPYFSRYARTIAVDMLGFGNTDKPDPETFVYSQQARAQHLANFIKVLGLKKINLVGNSMGGAAAAGCTLLTPESIKTLVLMGAAIKESHDVMVEVKKTNEVMKYDGTREGMRRVIEKLTYDYTPDEGLIDYRQTLAERPETMNAFRATMKWAFENGLYYTREELASISCPVLVIAGREDKMVPMERTLQIFNDMPNALGTFLPECGHWCMVEKPKEFTSICLRFFGLID